MLSWTVLTYRKLHKQKCIQYITKRIYKSVYKNSLLKGRTKIWTEAK